MSLHFSRSALLVALAAVILTGFAIPANAVECSGCSSTSPTVVCGCSDLPASGQLGVMTLEGSPGQTNVEVPVMISSSGIVQAFTVEIHFPTNLVTVTSVARGDLTQPWSELNATIDNVNGRVIVGGFTAGPGTILNNMTGSLAKLVVDVDANGCGPFELTGLEDHVASYEVCAASPPDVIGMSVDLLPGRCPNEFNPLFRPGFRVAIMGNSSLDVRDIDQSSLRLEGLTPFAGSIETGDIGTPDAELCPCSSPALDQHEDLVMTFSREQVVGALGPVQHDGDHTLTVTAVTLGGQALEGQGCLTINLPQSRALEERLRVVAQRAEFEITQPSQVTVKVFDVMGRIVDTLWDGHQAAGLHSLPINTDRYSSGVYFVRLESVEMRATTRFVVIK